MPGIDVRCAYSGQDVEGFVIWNAHHLLDSCCCIGEVVQRINVFLSPPREKLGVFLLDVRTIAKHDCREIARGWRTVDGPAVSATRQNRQSSRMIDVRMRQDDGIDALDWQGADSSRDSLDGVPETFHSLEAPSSHRYAGYDRTQ